MDVLAVILSALALFLSSFVKETYLNVIVYVLVGVILVILGFIHKKQLTKLILRVLLGVLLIIFTFVKNVVTFGALHSILSIIVGLLAFTSIFIKDKNQRL
jgi:hypothetical protein